jgi:hypothetical protein
MLGGECVGLGAVVNASDFVLLWNKSADYLQVCASTVHAVGHTWGTPVSVDHDAEFV